MIRSQAIRRSARGQTCTVRTPGHCNGDTETVVLAHLPFGGRGIGLKGDDSHAVYACSGCHDAIDGRAPMKVDYETLLEDCLRAMAETRRRQVEAGLVTVKGAA